ASHPGCYEPAGPSKPFGAGRWRLGISAIGSGGPRGSEKDRRRRALCCRSTERFVLAEVEPAAAGVSQARRTQRLFRLEVVLRAAGGAIPPGRYLPQYVHVLPAWAH